MPLTLTEEEKINLARIENMMKELPHHEAWRLPDIALSTHKIGGGQGSKEYTEQLNVLVQKWIGKLKALVINQGFFIETNTG